MVLRKFYACQQTQDESVTAYTAKLEELFAHAVEIKAVDTWNNQTILKRVFFQGLKQPIKQMSAYKFDTVDDYDRFKVEVRKIESELNLTKQEETNKTKCSAINKTEQKSELSEVKELLQQMNKRIEKLEQEKEERQNNDYGNFYRARGAAQGRGQFQRRTNYNRGRGVSRDRPSYRPTRPTGTNTMQPQCFKYSRRGHIARDCPKV